MSLARIIFLLFLVSCSNRETKVSDKLFQTYLSALFLKTTHLDCAKKPYQDHLTFEDPSNDTKVGFLQLTPKNLEIQDLLGGSIQNYENDLKMKLIFNTVPESINVDYPPANLLDFDLQISFHFFVPEEVAIGIFHHSNGEKKPMFWNQFNIQVFEFTQGIGTCGKPIKTDHSLDFICEKSLLPVLNKLNSASTFNAQVVYKDANYTYQDCY